MLSKICLVAFVVLLAGCFGGDNESPAGPDVPPDDDRPDPNGNGSNPPDPLQDGDRNETPVGEIPRAFEWGNCTSHQGAFQVWPAAISPGETPPGWNPPTPTINTVFLTFIDCERFSWGLFERPVLFAVEAHNRRGEVQKCIDQTSPITINVLHQIWTNDTEVAAYLTETYGIPTGVATIFHEDTQQQSVVARKWSLQPPGFEASYLVFEKWNDDAGDNDIPLRYIWWNGTIFGFLDLHRTYTSVADTMLSDGEMFPPTLNGEAGVQAWTGVGDWYRDMDVQGEIYLWRDTGCNEPF